jgi:hypothetical protein
LLADARKLRRCARDQAMFIPPVGDGVGFGHFIALSPNEVKLDCIRPSAALPREMRRGWRGEGTQ